MDLLREHVVYKANDSSRCQRQHCAIGDVYQPPLPERCQFYAIGAFIYTLPSIRALTDDEIYVPAIGYQKAFEFCQLVIRISTSLLPCDEDDDRMNRSTVLFEGVSTSQKNRFGGGLEYECDNVPFSKRSSSRNIAYSVLKNEPLRNL